MQQKIQEIYVGIGIIIAVLREVGWDTRIYIAKKRNNFP